MLVAEHRDDKPARRLERRVHRALAGRLRHKGDSQLLAAPRHAQFRLGAHDFDMGFRRRSTEHQRVSDQRSHRLVVVEVVVSLPVVANPRSRYRLADKLILLGEKLDVDSLIQPLQAHGPSRGPAPPFPALLDERLEASSGHPPCKPRSRSGSECTRAGTRRQSLQRTQGPLPRLQLGNSPNEWDGSRPLMHYPRSLGVAPARHVRELRSSPWVELVEAPPVPVHDPRRSLCSGALVNPCHRSALEQLVEERFIGYLSRAGNRPRALRALARHDIDGSSQDSVEDRIPELADRQVKVLRSERETLGVSGSDQRGDMRRAFQGWQQDDALSRLLSPLPYPEIEQLAGTRVPTLLARSASVQPNRVRRAFAGQPPVQLVRLASKQAIPDDQPLLPSPTGPTLLCNFEAVDDLPNGLEVPMRRLHDSPDRRVADRPCP